MQIQSVKIKNFRCFNSFELSPTKCHAFIGENGSGKTAVIEAINLATSLGGASSKIDEQDFNNSDENKELSIEVYFDNPFISKVPDGYQTRDIPCRGVRLVAHRRSRAAPGRALSPQFVVSQTVIPMEYESDSQPAITLKSGARPDLPTYVRKTTEGYESVRKNGNALPLSERVLGLQNDLAGYPNVFYFPKDREKESKTGFSTLLRKIAIDLNWRYRTKWNQEEIVKKWNDFYGEVIKTVEDAKDGRVIEPIKSKMKDFVGRELAGLELSLLDLEQPFSKSFFSQRDNSNIIEQSNLGSGISILLSYFLLETISLLSKEDVIFLIDEPELHLHPQLKQKFLLAFRDASHQVIYTTQSDCFVDVSEWQSITRFCGDFSKKPDESVLDSVMDGEKVREHLNDIKQWYQHKTIFFREDNQLFFANKAVLVEGPAEKYGLPVLAQKLGKDLGNVTILSCNGKSKIPYYQLLCRTFGISYFTILDLDGEAETTTMNKRVIDSIENSFVSKISTSFESVLGISSSEEHKASETLAKIDSIDVASIPDTIKTLITEVATWSSSTT